jgi:hypothetical protein
VCIFIFRRFIGAPGSPGDGLVIRPIFIQTLVAQGLQVPVSIEGFARGHCLAAAKGSTFLSLCRLKHLPLFTF